MYLTVSYNIRQGPKEIVIQPPGHETIPIHFRNREATAPMISVTCLFQLNMLDDIVALLTATLKDYIP